MEWPLTILGLAALGGLALAGIRLSGTPRPPTALALAHGAVAAVGLIWLIYAIYIGTVSTMTQVGTGVLVLAALGGAVMFVGFHLRGRALPIPLVLGHGLIAVTGLVLVLVSVS